VEIRKQARRWEGRFLGPRVNCERVPALPACVVRLVLDDPRGISYLLIWKDPQNETVWDAVRIAKYSEPNALDWTGWVEIKRATGVRSLLHAIARPLPRNIGEHRLVVCPHCYKPKRALYGWEVNRARTHSVFIAQWQCRTCAGLRYASEGEALCIRSRTALGRRFGVMRSDRPELWYPYAFADPSQAAEAGFCKIG
jgi:hypothetical protein